MSQMRKIYMARFILRCLTLIAVTILMFRAPAQFVPFQKGAFLDRVTLLHILWTVWIADMLAQLVPSTKAVTALGSQKSFKKHFRALLTPVSAQELRSKAREATVRAYVVFVIWALLIAALGVLHAKKILSDLALLWISTLFYVCDLICVLFWCPFRHFIMKNRCCTTCRIFNWDHLMMFTPLMFVEGFFSRSLLLLSILVFLVWEWIAWRFPERFLECGNRALKCSECTDLLCIHAKKLHPESVGK